MENIPHADNSRGKTRISRKLTLSSVHKLPIRVRLLIISFTAPHPTAETLTNVAPAKLNNRKAWQAINFTNKKDVTRTWDTTYLANVVSKGNTASSCPHVNEKAMRCFIYGSNP